MIRTNGKTDSVGIRDRLIKQYNDDELLFADGFDEAIIGITLGTLNRVVYDASLMATKLVADGKMDYPDAWEYLDFNTFQAYVGERTPVYVNLEGKK